jgi:hypothetical protein
MANQLNRDSKNKNSSLLKIVLGVVGIFVIICGVIVFSVFYKFARPYYEPKAQIIIEPDYSQVSTVNPSDLEAAAQILNARCLSLGCGVSFTVSENNQIIAQVPISMSNNFPGTTIAVGLLEIVDFGETPIPDGTIIATDFGYKYFPQASGIKWHTIITNNEFKSANATRTTSGKFQVLFTLSAGGTKILSDYTTNNIGHYLGIVLDKVVLASPKVNSPITGGTGVISGNYTREMAESLAVYLNTKGPLPIPLKVK